MFMYIPVGRFVILFYMYMYTVYMLTMSQMKLGSLFRAKLLYLYKHVSYLFL